MTHVKLLLPRFEIWECLCDCGRIKHIRKDALLSGATQSCGCYQKEQVSKSNFKNLIGKTFGRWTVVDLCEHRKKGHRIWKCVCECGSIAYIPTGELNRGDTCSCGCLQKELASKRHTTHGMSRTREYHNVKDMQRRELEKLHDTEWNDKLAIALKEFQTECVICGTTREEHYKKYGKDIHIDHVLPLSKGYGLKPGNAVILCDSCNRRKLAKSLDKLPLPIVNTLLEEAMHFNAYWYQLENNS